MYNWLLAVHILGAVLWVGGSATLQVMASRVRASEDDARMSAFTRDAEWVGQRLFMPASILVLLAGIGLVTEGGWGFSAPWVVIGLVAIIASALTGALFIGPESGRIGRLIQERGPEDSQVQARMARIFTVSRIELVVLVLVVIDMAVKPGA
jgi:uncharacterized membrane protein